jgi:hypothetical protein
LLLPNPPPPLPLALLPLQVIAWDPVLDVRVAGGCLQLLAVALCPPPPCLLDVNAVKCHVIAAAAAAAGAAGDCLDPLA